MVSPCCHKESRFLVTGQEYGHDDRYVRKVRSAGIRRVDSECVTLADCLAMAGHYCPHTLSHGSKVNGHVRCVGHEVAMAVENRA